MNRVSNDTFYTRAFQDMRREQTEIARLQAQIGSGLRLLKPSDDPSAAARALDIGDTLARIDQYRENATIAGQRLNLEDTTLEGIQNLLVRVKELALAANSGTQTRETRTAYGSEVRERLEELLDFANVKDAQGDYLFTGFTGDARPFSLIGGAVSYDGDQGVRELQVSATRAVAVGDSGDRVFMRIPGGNGSFTVDADPSNTGTGVMEAGSVIDSSAYTYHDYSVRFTAPGVYDVVDDTLGVTVLAAQPFSEGASIQFDGVETRITGQPAAGDRFVLAPNSAQSAFETLQSFITTMEQNPADAAASARLNQSMNGVIDSLDRAIEHVLEVRTTVGARLNAMEAVEAESEDLRVELEITRSELRDVSMDEAIGRLQQRITALQAVQQSFVSVARLSLFDFLR